jgi:hypothetical protein
VRHRLSVDSDPEAAAVPDSVPRQTSFAVDGGNSTNMAPDWNDAQPSSAYPTFHSAFTTSGFGGVPDYSFSSMPGMPDTMSTVDMNVDMSMFGGMGFNLTDVFESATWENLIGSTTSAIPIPGWDGNGQMGNE